MLSYQERGINASLRLSDTWRMDRGVAVFISVVYL